MNTAYLSVGFAVILALLVALVGPWFVTWNDYKASFEREVSALIGQQVTVIGEIEARVLPIPTVTLGDVVIGRIEAPLARIAAFRMNVELMPLLKGEIQITDMALDRPDLFVTVGADGVLAPGAPVTRAANAAARWHGIAFASITLRQGRVLVRDERSDRTLVIEAIEATASAPALAGPWRIEGTARAEDEAVAVRIATTLPAADTPDSLPVRVRAEWPDRHLRMVLDGLANTAQSTPTLNGDLQLAYAPAVVKGDRNENQKLPWRLNARLAATASAIDARETSIIIGPDERATTLTGSSRLTLGERPRLDLALATRQIDIDRLLGKAAGTAVPTGDVVDAVRAALIALPAPPIPLQLALEVPGIVAGGGLLTDFAIRAASQPQGWRIDDLAVRLPGQTSVAFSGRLDTLVDVSFDGRLNVSSEQPTMLLQWAGADLSARLDPIGLSGDLALGGGRFTFDDLAVELNQARLRGKVHYSPVRTAGPGGELTIEIDADDLNIDDLADFYPLVSRDGKLTLGGPVAAIDLKLWAGQARWASHRASGVNVQGRLADDALDVTRLDIVDLNGARLSASGRLDRVSTTPDGRMRLKLETPRVAGLADLARALAPAHPVATWMTDTAARLSPLDLDIALDGTTAPARIALTAKGTAAGTRIDGASELLGRFDAWREGTIRLTLRLDAPAGNQIAGQLGIDLPAARPARPDRVVLDLSGRPGDQLTVALDAALGDQVKAQVNGRFGWRESGPNPIALTGTLASADIGEVIDRTPWATLAPQRRLPGEIRATVSGTDQQITISALAGRIGATPFEGTATLDRTGSIARLDGQVTTDALNLAALTEPIFGLDAQDPPATTERGPWPTNAFSTPNAFPLNARLGVRAPSLAVAPGLVLTGAQFDWRVSPDQMSFENINGRLAGGQVLANWRLRLAPRGEVRADLEAHIKNAGAADLLWLVDGRPALSGRLDASLIAETTGRSISAQVANLTGNGIVTLADGDLQKSDLVAAFGAVLRAVDNGVGIEDIKLRPIFTSALDRGALRFSRIEAPVSIAGGVARLPNIALDTKGGSIVGSAVLDLGKSTLQGSAILGIDAGAEAVTGAEPRAELVFSGPLASPRRTIDTGPLVAYLTLRAYEREAQRVQDLQSEIIERERFAREMRRMREERLRREAEALARRRQAEDRVRLNEYQRVLAIEEEARRALERERERRSAADPLVPGSATPLPTTPTPGFEDRIRSLLDPTAPPPQIQPLVPQAPLPRVQALPPLPIPPAPIPLAPPAQ